jgi:hypothetical protein
VYQKNYQRKNRDWATKKHVEYCKRYPDKHAANQKRWRDKNKEKYNAYQREYQRALKAKRKESEN